MAFVEWPKRARPYRDEKLYRLRPRLTGPDLIQRSYDVLDCFQEVADYIDSSFPNSDLPMDRIPLQAAEKDPFGLPNFFVQYSLNKRRRWEIPRKLDDIEALQDPSVALRVSTFEFSLDPILEWYAPFIAGNAWFSPRDHLSYNVVRMNTVYPDGEVSHREANLNARGSDLYLKPNPPRRRRRRRIKNAIKPTRAMCCPSEEGLRPWERNVHALYIMIRATRSKNNINKSTRKVEGHSSYGPWKKNERPVLFKELMDEYYSVETPDHYCGCRSCLEITDVDYDPDPAFVSTLEERKSYAICEFITPKIKNAKKRKRKGEKNDQAWIEKKVDDDFEMIEMKDAETGSPEEAPLIEIPVLPQYHDDLPLEEHVKKDLQVTFLPPATVYRTPTAVIFHQDDISWINERRIVPQNARNPTVRLSLMERVLCPETIGKGHVYDMDTIAMTQLTPPIMNYCAVCSCLNTPGFSLACGHFFCFDCWRYRFAIGISRNVVPITCMEPGCEEQLPPEAAMCFIPETFVERYRTLLIKNLSRDPNHWNCWRCSRTLRVIEDIPKNVVKCPCGALTCGLCKEMVHVPATCKEYEMYSDLLRRNGQSISRVAFTHGSVGMKCPHCGQLVFRIIGCPNMRCICGTSFCYYCGERYGFRSHASCPERGERSWTLVDVDTRNMGNLPAVVFETLAEIRNLKGYEALKVPKKNYPDEAIRTYVEIVTFLELATVALFYHTQRCHPKRGDFRHKAVKNSLTRLGYVLKRGEFDVQTLNVAMKSLLRAKNLLDSMRSS